MGSYAVHYLSSDGNNGRYLEQGYRTAKKSGVNDKRSEFLVYTSTVLAY